ncbi:hypothetical protein ABW20_dc0101217 [Dactylellina cionopaga]|nr:hypothetical protein ABW20_dc0101217 [Dactylellina cionopaga]
MSSKSLGPTASLIRQSRLMSMPAPLQETLSDSQLYRLPYPTHQAITTPESSRRRGDWGLKRPIPRRVENTYIRYNNIDTMEHMTKIESAHDTVFTLKKWQEMDIPLKLREQTLNRFTSAFHFDTITSNSHNTETPQSSTKQPVWGYREKFVQHMTPGELKTLISKKLIPRRLEFEKFAETWFPPPTPMPQAPTLEIDVDLTDAATTPGDPLEQSPPLTDISSLESPSPEILTSKEASDNLVSPLLPNFSVTSSGSTLKTVRFDAIKAYNVVSQFLQIPLRQVPLAMHPSGGLHYILDSSYLENHPEHGPNNHKEVPARLIHKLDNRMETFRRRTFYVIGGIIQYAQHEHGNQNSLDHAYSVSRVIKVVPLAAELDHRGKINIELDRIAPNQIYPNMILNSWDRIQSRSSLESAKTDLDAMKSGAQLADSRGKTPNQPDQLDNQLASILNFLDLPKT